MNSYDILNLQEAYLEIYEEAEELEEKRIATGTGKKAIPSASERSSLAKKARAGKDIGKKGKMFKKIAAKAAKKYDSEEAGKRVAAAAMFKSQAHEEVDIYDVVLSHLLDEGYADTEKAAEAIMVNMSEEWRNEILSEKFVSPYEGKASYTNPQGLSPATRAMQKSDELQKTELGSKRQKLQTKRSQQLNRMYQAARRS